MEGALSAVEIRALGCLIEKQITVPESYPLTLNALLSACNQTTNRDPVTSYDESAVAAALEGLREKGFVRRVIGARAPRYEHRFNEQYTLGRGETAAMCVLMLRGPQTAGEIRARAGRLHAFAGLEEVEAALQSLVGAAPPLAIRLPRLPGTKESRVAHLLGGEPRAADEAQAGESQPGPAGSEAHADPDRLARLEAEVGGLRQEVQELRQQLLDLKRPSE